MKIDLKKAFSVLSPRLVVLVTTMNKAKAINAAPISFVCPISFDPPIIMLSIRPVRHTYQNIIETKEFVINVLSKKYAEQILRCAAPYPPGINKLDIVGLHWYSSERIRVPRVKEGVLWLECKFLEEKKMGDHVIIFAEVVCAEAKDDVISEGEIDFEKVNPLLHIQKNKFAVDFKVVKYKRYD